MDNVIVYDSFFDVILGDLDLLADPVHTLLVTEAYVPDPAHRTVADVWGEILGRGYSPGGKALEEKSTYAGIFRAANLIWPKATIKDAARAVLYRPRDGQLICCLTLDEPASSTNREFALLWATEGILDLKRLRE